MATETTITRPSPYIEALGEQYGQDLTALTAKQMPTAGYAPTVAGQDPAQAAAYTRATTQGQGIGAYQPYITQAEAYTGPGSQSAFMSPYQQDVIDTTMTEYDTQAQKGLTGIGQLAAKSGNLGGGREGVMRSEFKTRSDLQRALLDYQMRNQGFMQANQLAGQAFGQQMNMAGTVPGLERADIAGLESAGAGRRATAQAVADAERETARLRAYEPYERLGYLGSGIGSMLSGYPAQFQSSVQPNPTPLQTAMGIGAVGSGILGNLKGLYS